MKLRKLREKKFYNEYEALSSPMIDYSKEDELAIHGEFEKLSEKLIAALSKWEEDEDYCLSYDWNVCRHHSIAIYSESMYSAQFVELVSEVLSQGFGSWCLDVACECEDLKEGEFFIYQGEMVVNSSSGLKYKKFFQ